MSNRAAVQEITDDFVSRMASATPEIQAALFIDTNVMVEIMSIGDLLREASRAGSAEAFLVSPKSRYRQLRSRYANLVAWWLAKTNTPAGMHGAEVIAMLGTRLAPTAASDPNGLLGDHEFQRRASYAFTTGIVHVVRDYAIKAPIGAVIDMNHRSAGDDSDTEIIRICKRDDLPLITDEGNSHNGISLSKRNGDRNLRGRCIDVGVPVYTPLEFLQLKNVDLRAAAREFVDRCESGVLEAAVDGVLMSTASGRDLMSNIIPTYRWIMLNEVNPTLSYLNQFPEGE